MSDITLIRHGQAQTGAQTEAGYDSLSDLGRQQARWLGEYFDEAGVRFDRVYTGALTRHIQTEEEMAGAKALANGCEIIVDERLNEMEYFDLSNRMHEQFGITPPDGREGFIEHMPLVFSAWRDGQIKGASETFQNFESRVEESLADIAAGPGRALVVTSGGLIAMAVRVSMGLDMGAFARLTTTIKNTSVHQLHPIGTRLTLTQFNAVPHLEHNDRRHAQTYI